MCTVGEQVPNEDQTACVGMFEKLTLVHYITLLLYLSCIREITLDRNTIFSRHDERLMA